MKRRGDLVRKLKLSYLTLSYLWSVLCLLFMLDLRVRFSELLDEIKTTEKLPFLLCKYCSFHCRTKNTSDVMLEDKCGVWYVKLWPEKGRGRNKTAYLNTLRSITVQWGGSISQTVWCCLWHFTGVRVLTHNVSEAPNHIFFTSFLTHIFSV